MLQVKNCDHEEREDHEASEYRLILNFVPFVVSS